MFSTQVNNYRLVAWRVVVITMPASFKSSVVTTAPQCLLKCGTAFGFLIFLCIILMASLGLS